MDILKKLDKYIKSNLEVPRRSRISFGQAKNAMYAGEALECASAPMLDSDINTFIDNNKNDDRFQKLLFSYIDDKNLKDSDVYNKVNIDRSLFSKIRNDNYHPSKDTVILLGLSLELDENQIEKLLDSASYSLPKNNNRDLIIRFCFIEQIYNPIKVNELLDNYNCSLLN